MAETLQEGKQLRVVLDGTMTGLWFAIVGEDNYYADGSPHELARTNTCQVSNSLTGKWEPTPDYAELEAFAYQAAAASELLEVLIAYHTLLHGAVWSDCSVEQCRGRAAIEKARGMQ